MSDNKTDVNNKTGGLADDIDLSFDAFNPVKSQQEQSGQPANPPVPAVPADAQTPVPPAPTGQPAPTTPPESAATSAQSSQDEAYAQELKAMESLAASGHKSKTGLERKILELKNKKLVNINKLVIYAAAGMLVFVIAAVIVLRPKVFKDNIPNLMDSIGIPLENINVVRFSSNLIVFEDIRPPRGKGWELRSLAIEKPPGDLERAREFRRITIDGLRLDGSFENFLMSEGTNEIISMLFNRDGRNKLHIADIIIRNM
ncbi:MAG: hypothetical protein FWF01_02210, partial [Alphaproteobacteria bacterium]|nr:hypothetical protein [Alphaproteobacteria bacterium]